MEYLAGLYHGTVMFPLLAALCVYILFGYSFYGWFSHREDFDSDLKFWLHLAVCALCLFVLLANSFFIINVDEAIAYFGN